MTMLAGSVTVSALGISSGTGAALAGYNALRAAQGIAENPINAKALQEMAKFCTAQATMITYILANIQVTATPTLTVPLGIPVATAGTAAAQTGATTSTGTATGTVTSVVL